MDKVFQYDNGLRLICNYNPTVKSVSVGVLFGVGCYLEDETNNGISHFIEHMNFKGTQKRNAFQIAEEMDSIGAQINAFTSKSCTVYYTISTDEHVSECMEMLGDILFHSTFDEKEMQREKGVVMEEIAMNEDSPEDLCMDMLSTAYFNNHVLAMPILGTKSTVNSFSAKQLKSYINRFYFPKNTVISVSGNMPFEKAEELTAKYFYPYFKNENRELRESSHVGSSQYIEKIKDLEQANLGLAFPSAPFNSRDELTLTLLNIVFGGGMSSRLFQKVREEMGLAYSIYSYSQSYYNNGFNIVYLGTNTQTVESALRAIKSEIDLLKAKGISEAELKKGKEQMKSAYILGRENTASIMRTNGKYLLMSDEVFNVEEKVAAINAISVEDVNRVASNVFDFNRVSAAYLGKKIKFDPMKILKE